MQDEITSDDSVIRHHYQRRGWGERGEGVFWRGGGAGGSLCNGMIWITLCRPTLHPAHFLCLPVKRDDDREHDIAGE